MGGSFAVRKGCSLTRTSSKPQVTHIITGGELQLSGAGGQGRAAGEG